MKRVAIVGAGISGLAAAYRLRRLAPALQITLLEQALQPGGKIATEHVDGFVVEAAPDSFLSRKPGGIRLCQELGISDRLYGPNQERRKTYVRYDGRLYRLPEGLTGLVPTDLDALARSPLISEEGRRRLAQEPEIPAAPGDEDETIGSFISRRLGREVFERLVEPLMGGIYAGDAWQLSLAATFPELRRLERAHGSLIRGLLANQQQTPAHSTAYPPFVTLPDGMRELVQRLLECTPALDLRLGTTVESITSRTDGYALTLSSGEQLAAQALILATPAYVTARLVEPLDAELAAAHAAIPYASTATVSLAFALPDLPAPLDGFGYVIPRVEDPTVLACTWTSSKWSGRAPQGHVLLRLYLGRYGHSVLHEPDERLLELSLAELRQTLGISAEPRLSRIYRWPNSMPQYTLGHLQRLATIEARLAEQRGLLVAGAAYRGVGIPDCISSGERAAEAAAQLLAR